MSAPGPKPRRRGMILLNVLIVVALSAAAVTVMIVAQDIEVRRAIRLRDAAQAQSYARAGELSAIVALRRDFATAPHVDTLAEAWNSVGQRAIEIPGGEFALSISDEQSRFNVNAVMLGDPSAASALKAIGEAAGVSAQTIDALILAASTLGPLRDDGLLRTAGVAPRDLDRLAPYVAFLPADATLNLNTVDPGLVQILAREPGFATALASGRSAAAPAMTAATGGAAGLLGVNSRFFRVETDIRVGDVRRRTSSLIERRISPDGVRVSAVSRRRSSPAA